MGFKVDLKARKMTLSKKKDQGRSKIALNRLRVHGLFVTKKKEMLLEQRCADGNLSCESETVEPD